MSERVKMNMINRLIVIFISLLLFSAVAPVRAAEPLSSFRFRFYMHEIYHNFSNTYAALKAEKYEIADIHLKLIQEYSRNILPIVPKYNYDGTILDKNAFNIKVNSLQQTVAQTRKAVSNKKAEMAEELYRNTFNICVGCHTETKLKYLFRIPSPRSLFADYMHRLSDNFVLAEIYFESDEMQGTKDYLKVTNFYLSLLEDVLPDEGVSGSVMDKSGFLKRIREVERLNELVQVNIEEKKPVDFVSLKKALNEICVACHEPERIR